MTFDLTPRDRAWGVQVRSLGRSQSTPPPHQAGWQMLILVRGAARFTWEGMTGEPCQVEAGDVILRATVPRSDLQAMPGRPYLLHAMEIDGSWLEHLQGEGFFQRLPVVVHVGLDERLLDLVAQMLDLGSHRPPGYARLLSGGAFSLLARLEAALEQGPRGAQHRRMLHEVRERLADPAMDGLGLEALAAELGVGYTWLRRNFTAVTGVPPHHYRLHRKMEQAKRLLLDTDATIAVIGQRLGFASNAYFSRAFRKWTGLSPSLWRQFHGNSPAS